MELVSALFVIPPALPARQLQVYATPAMHKTALPRAVTELTASATESLSGMRLIIMGRAVLQDVNIVLDPA